MSNHGLEMYDEYVFLFCWVGRALAKGGYFPAAGQQPCPYLGGHQVVQHLADARLKVPRQALSRKKKSGTGHVRSERYARFDTLYLGVLQLLWR